MLYRMTWKDAAGISRLPIMKSLFFPHDYFQALCEDILTDEMARISPS